ncbi:hypothetical protein LTR78_008199 [Recurvomyces mirabilis]|uniref:Xylanolytic transcriptional activator regulatory domain-containing protein n=1 Tax=Recurvomyces mirabilis TaxID=574656 RepID=A0AAE0WHR6_9PEZI|nr:hypothetical protein LTR78_008199 [Recurvomyces mirabilis]KAK5156485.1 hypothetical protein LTS14_004696 [Recurvomyces mirabilis]
MATTAIAASNDQYSMMSRPQIGIDRLPHHGKLAANGVVEADELKIKCNRIRPSCEACQVFNCACIYDAIPKKRGPKTDVLEALLKRVNGLEKRLKDEKKPDSADGQTDEEQPDEQVQQLRKVAARNGEEKATIQVRAVELLQDEQPAHQQVNQQATPQIIQQHRTHHNVQQPIQALPATDALIDTYFARVHGKPYYVLDEPATRQRLRDGNLPHFLLSAIHAVSIRYCSHLYADLSTANRHSQECALQSRADIDVDEPSIEHLQALLLLAMAAYQSGKGKKCYMLLTHAVSMAFGLSLHRELPPQLRIAPSEREGRRKLFWTCYLMDHFTVAGSKRPSLISDESICLRLPAWLPPGAHGWVDGSYFPNGTSLPYAAGVGNAGQGSGAMLVEISRVLGVTNRYLAAGGVKGDSHFPWHAQSTLSRIRSDLDYWAANTQDAFTTIEALFGQPDTSTLVLSKLIYHLIHCLVYRPFLPVDLAELSGTGQHQSWQIEATNLCFLHANAIAELVEIGQSTSLMDWPSFVGYCICTAGTIHVHGAHYMALREGDVFAHSADFLSREMAQLHELRFAWVGVQHQRETLQTVYSSHSQLVKSLSTSPTRFSPVFQMEDFFDRYPGSYIDGAHCSFTDVDPAVLMDSISNYNGYGYNSADAWMNSTTASLQTQPMVPTQYMTQNQMPTVHRKAKRRRTTAATIPHPAVSSNGAGAASAERRVSTESFLPKGQQHQQPQSQPIHIPDDTPQYNGHQTGASRNDNNEYAIIDDQIQNPTFTQSALSPSFNYSPMPPAMPLQRSLSNEANNCMSRDNFNYGYNFEQRTPGGFSQSAESTHTDPQDKDPFLTLLEQLAQNEGNGDANGPSELDFFLTGQG